MSNNLFQNCRIQSVLHYQFQGTIASIQFDYCRGTIQCFRDTNHDPIENHGEVHLRGESAGNVLQFLALPILYFYTTAYLSTLDGCCQDMCHSADKSLERFTSICINACTAQFKRTKYLILNYEWGNQRRMQVRSTAQCVATLCRGTI